MVTARPPCQCVSHQHQAAGLCGQTGLTIREVRMASTQTATLENNYHK